MHKTNHPYTMHLQASVWDVDLAEVCAGRPVGLAWFSPDCKHFSKAKGSALVDRNIRGLAWIVLRWAGTVRPRVIILENVEEFTTWGPVRKGKPVKKKAGQTFRKWLRQLKDCGYHVEHRELVAADYGAPTTRKRFVLVARCDGRPIIWPARTHAPVGSEEVKTGKCLPWRSAAEVIDWTLPMYSIFDSKQEIKEKYGATVVRPLADNTMRRVIRGVDKYTIRSGKPFIIECNHTSNRTEYDTFRGGDIDDPMHTVTTREREAFVAAHVVEFKGQDKGQSCEKPLRTITASVGEFGLCETVIVRADKEQDFGHWPEIRTLLNQHCNYQLAEDEVLPLVLDGTAYFIRDILLRMLAPKELYAAMGFPPDYIIDHDYTGKPYPRSAQVARCGNAVCPQMASAVVRANLPEWAIELHTMKDLEDLIAV